MTALGIIVGQDQPKPTDFGHAIAVEYWRTTPHVFSSQGKNKPCWLCLQPPESVPHKEGEPYVQQQVTSVQGLTAALSCGHQVHTGGMRVQPIVGDSYNCLACRSAVDDRNYPGLPREIRERIEATLPKCSECGGAIEKIPFVQRTMHTFDGTIDFQSGEIYASSEHHDTLDEDPDWTIRTEGGRLVRVLEVQCAEGHSWYERRLHHSYRAGEHVWTVLPPADTTPPTGTAA